MEHAIDITRIKVHMEMHYNSTLNHGTIELAFDSESDPHIIEFSKIDKTAYVSHVMPVAIVSAMIDASSEQQSILDDLWASSSSSIITIDGGGVLVFRNHQYIDGCLKHFILAIRQEGISIDGNVVLSIRRKIRIMISSIV